MLNANTCQAQCRSPPSRQSRDGPRRSSSPASLREPVQPQRPAGIICHHEPVTGNTRRIRHRRPNARSQPRARDQAKTIRVRRPEQQKVIYQFLDAQNWRACRSARRSAPGVDHKCTVRIAAKIRRRDRECPREQIRISRIRMRRRHRRDSAIVRRLRLRRDCAVIRQARGIRPQITARRQLRK